MAFELVNLTIFANNMKSKVVPSLWEYYNKNGDNVAAAGYIPYSTGLKNNDRVLVVTTSNKVQPAWYYASISNKVITLVACDTVPASISLDSLQDVEITEAASGNFLKYNGSKWVNDTPETPSLSG